MTELQQLALLHCLPLQRIHAVRSSGWNTIPRQLYDVDCLVVGSDIFPASPLKVSLIASRESQTLRIFLKPRRMEAWNAALFPAGKGKGFFWGLCMKG
ncbi:hypothetical protein BDW72DRAFT_180959 [Aspergillus terricola var. indicus]